MIRIIVDDKDLSGIDPEHIIRAVDSGIKKSIITIEATAKEETPVDVGFLRNAFRVRTSRLRGELYNTAFYAKFVHDGTKPHAVSTEEIRKWATRKGLNPFMVAKGIRKRGTRANPFMDRTLQKTEHKIQGIVQNELNKIL